MRLKQILHLLLMGTGTIAHQLSLSFYRQTFAFSSPLIARAANMLLKQNVRMNNLIYLCLSVQVQQSRLPKRIVTSFLDYRGN
jgi:hypothetical protein